MCSVNSVCNVSLLSESWMDICLQKVIYIKRVHSHYCLRNVLFIQHMKPVVIKALQYSVCIKKIQKAKTVLNRIANK